MTVEDESVTSNAINYKLFICLQSFKKALTAALVIQLPKPETKTADQCEAQVQKAHPATECFETCRAQIISIKTQEKPPQETSRVI